MAHLSTRLLLRAPPFVMTVKPVSPYRYRGLSDQNSQVVQIDDSPSSDAPLWAPGESAEGSFLLNRNDRPESSHHQHVEQTATVPSEIANITKNLIGGGVLSLSQGIALFADSPAALTYSLCYIVITGFVMGYFCLL